MSMNAKIKFSVLISVYYKETASNLKISLNSIINQSILPNEIVLVEDGKLTQALYDVIDDFLVKYPKLFTIIKIEKNSGLGNALNVGLKACKYDYVARMDSDDFSNFNRFEKQIDAITNLDVDVIGSLIDEYDSNMNNKISTRYVPQNDYDIKKYAKNRNPINHVSVFFNKNKVLKVGSYIDCPYFEDYYLWVRMFKNNCKFYNIQESLVKVRGGFDMINRRGGRQYISAITNFETKILKIGFINFFEYFFNMFVRIVIAIVPNYIREYIYKKKLRGV